MERFFLCVCLFFFYLFFSIHPFLVFFCSFSFQHLPFWSFIFLSFCWTFDMQSVWGFTVLYSAVTHCSGQYHILHYPVNYLLLITLYTCNKHTQNLIIDTCTMLALNLLWFCTCLLVLIWSFCCRNGAVSVWWLVCRVTKGLIGSGVQPWCNPWWLTWLKTPLTNYLFIHVFLHLFVFVFAECPPSDPHIQYIAKSTFSIDSSATITADTANELADVDSFGSVEEVIKALLNFKDSRWGLQVYVTFNTKP